MLKVKTALDFSNPSLCGLLGGAVDPGSRPLAKALVVSVIPRSRR